MKSYLQFVMEEMPTNAAGSGNVDGIGVGPRGEPGVKSATMLKRFQKKKKKVSSDAPEQESRRVR